MPVQPQRIQQPPDIPDVVKKQEVSSQPLPKLEDDERLRIKESCLSCAVEMMKTFDNEAKEFEQLISEVKTLTVYFYRIIVTKNELWAQEVKNEKDRNRP